MKHRLPAALLLCLGSFFSFGQKIYLSGSPSQVCIETPLSLPFTSALPPGPGNTFKVQLRRYAGEPIRDLPTLARATGSVLTFAFPDPRTLGFTSYEATGSFSYRVVGGTPVTESDWINVQFRFPVQLSSLEASPGVVNPDEGTLVRFSASGSQPITVVFTDSSRVVLNPNSSDLGFQVTTPVFSDRSRTFTVASVRNECGVGTGSGSFSVAVNAFSLRATSVSPQNLCEGGTLRVGLSKTGGEFNAGNTFKIQLVPASISGFPVPATLTLDATEEGGFVKAVLPKNTAFDPGREYTVRIVASQPGLISTPVGRVMRLWPAPSAELTTSSFSTDFNNSISLGARFLGAGPFRAELSDGTVLTAPEAYSNSAPTAYASVAAQRTTDYRIVAFSSGCDVPPTIVPTTTRVEVRNGLVLDSLPNTSVCEGQPVSARLRSNLTLPANLTVFLRQTRYNPSSQVFNWSVPARLDGSRLTFTLPTVGPVDVSQGFSSPSPSYEIWVEHNGIRTTSYNSISINSKPTLAFASGGTHYPPSNNQVELYLNQGGGGPYSILLDNGLSYLSSGGSIQIPIFQTTTYRIRRVNNACGQTDVDLATTVTVPASTGIALQPVRAEFCQGDSLPLRFQAFGSYVGSNQFRVQVRKNYGEWTTVAAQSALSSGTTIRPDEGTYEVRVASTEPVLYSATATFRVRAKPTARVTGSGSGSSARVVLGDGLSLYLTLTGGEPYALVLSNGTRDYAFNGYVGSPYFTPESEGTYRVKTIANACGTGTASGEVAVTVQPLQVELGSFTDYEVCQNTGLTAAIRVRGRGATTATRYRLQLVNPSDTAQVAATFEETAGLLLRGTLAANVSSGRYALRVVSSNPATVSAPLAQLTVAAPPTALLTAQDGSSAILTESSAALKVTLTGSPFYNVLFSDNTAVSFSENPGYRSVSPTRGSTYGLRRVYNVCGYGTVSGQVAVQVKPTLQVFRLSTETLCPGRSLRLRLDARGDYEADNRFRFDLLNGQNQALVARLDSGRVTQADYLLTMPGTLAGGSYLLRVTSTRPALTLFVPVLINATPLLTLTGGATINPGRTAYLRLTNATTTGAWDAIQYTLSGNVTGQWEPYQGTALNVPVTPAATTTYTLLSASNVCGAGSVSGSATVTVNSPADRTVDIPTPSFFEERLCAGDTARVTFETKGSFSTGNRFTVQLSDSTGSNFRDLVTVGQQSPLRGAIPGITPRGSGYRLRVVASDAGTQSGHSPYAYAVRLKATAAFDTDVLSYLPGKVAKAVVRFTGDSPWTYTLGTDAGSFSRSASRNPDTLTLQPASPTLFYRLSAVRNECGAGTIGNPATLKVELITALEPTAPTLRVFPNPTAQRLRVEGLSAPTELRLMTPGGQLLRRVRHAPDGTELDLSALPAGVYLLQVNRETGPVTYRVVKE